MKIDQFDRTSVTELNKSMRELVGWNIDLDKLNPGKASAMLESTLRAIKEHRARNLHESQTSKNYNGMVLAKKVLEKYLGEQSASDIVRAAHEESKQQVTEGSVSDAEVTLAAQDMADRIQGMIEDIGEMTNEELGPLSDKMREMISPETGDQFKATVESTLNMLMDSLRSAKEELDGAVRGLSGDEPIPMASPEVGGDMDMDMDDDMDADFDASDDEEFNPSDAAVGGDDPLGRKAR